MSASSNASSDLEQYSQLIEVLYASLWDGKGFEDFLYSFAQHFNCCTATLMAVQQFPNRHLSYGWNIGLPEKYERWYLENNMVEQDPAIDLFVAGSLERKGFIAAAHELAGLSLIDAVDEVFKPWLKSEQIVDSAGLVIPSKEEGESLILALQRQADIGPFTADERQQLDLLAPHITQAVQLFNNFYTQKHENTSLQAAIKTIATPTLIINELLEIQQINDAAQDLLSNSAVLSSINNKLQLTDDELNHQFRLQAWSMVRSEDKRQQDSTLSFIVPQQEDELPMTINISPMCSHDDDNNGVFRGALIQIYDPQQYPLPKAERIQQVFNLSNKEALLCEYLLQGFTLKEVAEKRGISVHTVREQMRTISVKTGFNRQPELIAAILRALP